jgi:exodeoxyribonuclease V
MITLSSDQQIVLDGLLDWYDNQLNKQYITFGGYAGTGKTTLISFFRSELYKSEKDLKVAFCSFTGKATQVLKRKLHEHKAFYKGDFIGTIHSLTYQAITNVSGAIVGWKLREQEKVEYDLIIVDEASMVDEKIWLDLLSFRIPVVAVGDHGQLPPINGSFNLMKTPTLRLEQIHRQAINNPIIRLSILAREKGLIPFGRFGTAVEKLAIEEAGSDIEDAFLSYNNDTLFLCGYNSSRVKINNAIRAALGYETTFPESGDRVICLRNNREKGIFNGMQGTIEKLEKLDATKYKAQILMDGDVYGYYEGNISTEQFGSTTTLNNINGAVRTKNLDLFDFGYALTVHKAQGSQSLKVVLFEERFKQQDEEMWRRWLYTAVTRAEEQLTIFGSQNVN